MILLPESENPQEKEQIVYEAPAIIYEGVVSTRAGSPLGNPAGVDDIDPSDLFN